MSIAISIASVVITLFFNSFILYFNSRNNKRANNKDLMDTIKETTKMNLMLESIDKTMQVIERKIDTMCEELKSHSERLVKLEESVKFAHERISDLTKRVEEMEDD